MYPDARQSSLASLRGRPGLVVFVLAFVLRLAWVASLDNVLLWPDEREFAQVGMHLAAGDGYVSSSYRANPVVPFYLATFFRVFGENYLWPRIGQCVVGAVTCLLLLRLTTLVVSPTAGFLAGLMLALYPAHIYLAGVFYVTCILSLLVVAFVYAVVRAASAERPALFSILAGLCLGLATMTRAASLVYVPVACLALVYSNPKRWRSLVAAAAVLALCSAVVVVPWSIRNTRKFGRPMLVSSGLWATFWKGNNELSDGSADDRVQLWGTSLWESRLARLSKSERAAVSARYEDIARRIDASFESTGDIYLSRDEVLRPIVLAYVAENPGRFAQLFFSKVLVLFRSFSETEQDNRHTSSAAKLLAALSFYPILAFAVVGAILAIPMRRRLAPVYLTILSSVVLYGVLTACTRFRLPLDPLLLVFSSLAIERLVLRPVGGATVDRRSAVRGVYKKRSTEAVRWFTRTGRLHCDSASLVG